MTNPIDTTKGHVYRFGGVECDLDARTYLMGILNVTPDSFSDGGLFLDPEKALRRAAQMVEDGADILDVGGESSRPGSDPVSVDEELRRVLPVIARIAAEVRVPISIDTYKSAVADRALEAGAIIVNDISGLAFDPAMRDVVAKHNASVVIMHMLGTPKTMQNDPVYNDVVREVSDYLMYQADLAVKAGIRQIIVDPGIGFGKTLEHNLTLIRHLDSLKSLGYPVLVGPSRKSFLGTILGLSADERLEGTAAAVTASILNGASLIRVHDVKEMKRVAMVADRIRLSI